MRTERWLPAMFHEFPAPARCYRSGLYAISPEGLCAISIACENKALATDKGTRMKGEDIAAAWHGLSACERCSIREMVLFADLDATDFSMIHMPIDDLSYPPGSVIFNDEQPAGAVFTVRSGLVKMEQYLPTGTRRIVGLAKRGDVVGLEATVSDHYESTAIALQATKLCRIPKAVIHRLSQKLNRQLMRKWHDSVTQAHACIRDLSTGPTRPRVARLFLLLAPPDTRLCSLFGREDVGALLGVTTETASRTVAEFKRLKLVNEVAPNIFERDIAALERVATEE